MIEHAVSAYFSVFADLEMASFASFRADHGLMGCYRSSCWGKGFQVNTDTHEWVGSQTVSAPARALAGTPCPYESTACSMPARPLPISSRGAMPSGPRSPGSQIGHLPWTQNTGIMYIAPGLVQHWISCYHRFFTWAENNVMYETHTTLSRLALKILPHRKALLAGKNSLLAK